MSDDRPGYTDTPTVPGTEYCVHDPDRPRPPVVTPPTPPRDTPASPPSDATVLFDGTDLSAWESVDGGDPGWLVEDGYTEVVPGAGGIQTTDPVGDCQLHVEWQSPAEVSGDGQARGNSGVFLLDRYEVQILDSYDNPTYADGYAAAVYGQHPPDVNACRPPGEWQSFDIVWHGPTFEDGEAVDPARLTLFHNGVLVQDDVALVGPTTHRDVHEYSPHPDAGPLKLQEHDHRVRFRNVWYRSLDD
jgi:hypothetical protein